MDPWIAASLTSDSSSRSARARVEAAQGAEAQRHRGRRPGVASLAGSLAGGGRSEGCVYSLLVAFVCWFCLCVPFSGGCKRLSFSEENQRGAKTGVAASSRGELGASARIAGLDPNARLLATPIFGDPLVGSDQRLR